MPRRLLSVLLVAAVLVGSAGCAKSSTAAVEVNGAVYSHRDFKRELDELAGNDLLLADFQVDRAQLLGAGKGTYVPDFADQILSTRVQYMIFDAERAKRGLKITSANRTEAKQRGFSNPANADKILGGFSKGFAKLYLDDIAGTIALAHAIGDNDFNTWVSDALAKAEVKVSPRYGTWDRTTRAVVPLKGSTPAGGATTTTTLPSG